MDAEHDVLSALERWVEGGTPPSKLIATKFADDNPTGAITMQRPVCPYPQEAMFIGGPHDSTSVASNFECRAPKGHGHDDDDD
jgi:feruloyl esterase